MHKVTRGNGRLEKWLSKQRSNIANALILPQFRRGRILDIGCGTYPFFLANTEFAEKIGIDKAVHENASSLLDGHGIVFRTFDIEHEKVLPFEDDFIDVVTMLAVAEHLEPVQFESILGEIRRVLKPGGLLLMTTPAAWSHGLLKIMAVMNLVSKEEIDEHKMAYTHGILRALLGEAKFAKESISHGYFELTSTRLTRPGERLPHNSV